MKMKLGSLGIVLVSSLALFCGKKKSDDAAPAPQNNADLTAVAVKLGDTLKGEPKVLEAANLPAPYLYKAAQVFEVEVDRDMTIEIREKSSYSMCEEGGEKSDLLFTFENAAGLIASSDKVVHGDKAVAKLASVKITKGKTKITNTFYSSKACLSFGFQYKLGEVKLAATNPPPKSSTPVSETPVAVSIVDAEMVGNWVANQFGATDRMTVTANGIVTNLVKFGGDVIADLSQSSVFDTNASPKRVTLTVTEVRAQSGDPEIKVGDVARCIYKVAGSLTMECSDANAANFPVKFSNEASIYKK